MLYRSLLMARLHTMYIKELQLRLGESHRSQYNPQNLVTLADWKEKETNAI